MSDAVLRLMTPEDYPALFALWNSVPEFKRGLRSLDDSEAGILKFLKRNPTTCFVADIAGEIIGGILAGHDGRRGYIYHAVVLPEHQGKGIGKQLADAACDALRADGRPCSSRRLVGHVPVAQLAQSRLDGADRRLAGSLPLHDLVAVPQPAQHIPGVLVGHDT